MISDTQYNQGGSHENIVSQYRQLVKDAKQSTKPLHLKTVEEKLPVDMLSAEMAYNGKVGGVASCMFELTYNCSEKCIHCYNPGAARNEDEESRRHLTKTLTLDEYKRVIDEMYELGLYRVTLTGGDPFSYPHTWELMQYLYDKGVAFDIYTNGQKVYDKAEYIANLFPRSVGISLYSAVESDHDFITKIKGSCAKTLKFIYSLWNFAVPMALKCCIMKPNVRTYYTVYDVAEKVHAVPQMEINIVDSLDGDKCARLLRLSPKELEIVLRDDNIALYVGKEVTNYGARKRLTDQCACGAGDNTICLTPDGWIIPCCSLRIYYGNIAEQSLKEIMESDTRKKWLSLTLDDYDECGRHDYCDYCNLCSGNNLVEHGIPNKAGENNCYVAKVRYNLALKMKNENYDPLQDRSLRESLMSIVPYKPTAYKRIYDKIKEK